MITNILRIMLTRSFKPLVFTNDTNYKLNLDVNGLGIYVHIPFCRSLCPFCPYNKIVYDSDMAQIYKNALIKEINMAGQNDGTKRDITSVYFGGGTPALMIDDLHDILSALKYNFNIGGNIGIELHPKDVTMKNLKKLKSAGFDMVSIGIQSFSEKCLKSLGREYIDGKQKVALAHKAGFPVIDVDLIFGIPDQDENDLRDDFITAFEMGATQVSTYPFIDFSYAYNKRKPLGTKDKKKLLKTLKSTSSKAGCIRTSVWTFGKYGAPRYSSITRDNFIGFGPSAATLLKEVFKINTFSVGEYINAVNDNRIPTALTMKFSERSRALYWLFWNCYTLQLDKQGFYNIFSRDLEKVFGFELKIGRLLGLVFKRSGGYTLTERGAYLYHLMEQRYTLQYIDSTWRVSMENPWPEKVRLY